MKRLAKLLWDDPRDHAIKILWNERDAASAERDALRVEIDALRAEKVVPREAFDTLLAERDEARKDADDCEARYEGARKEAVRLREAMAEAVERITLANAEGDPILSAWLPSAKATLAEGGGL